MKERVIVFIDGIKMLRSEKALQIDYKKLVDFLVGDRELVKVYFYTLSQNEEFLESLKSLGFEIKLEKPAEESRVYSALATDMLGMAYYSSYDIGILVGGDDNFISVVIIKEIQGLGKRIEYADFRKSMSFPLRNVCNKFILLDDHENKFMKERVVVFINGPNIYNAAKKNSIKINYKKLVDLLVGNRYLVKSYFYTEAREKDLKREKFLENLKLQGIEVKEVDRKDLYNMLLIDMMRLAHWNDYDTGILVAGDSNLFYTVKRLQQLGKRIEYADFENTSNNELKKVCNKFIPLDDKKDRFKKERVIVFIDGSNIYKSAEDLGIKIDYKKLVDFLVDGRELVGAFYYGSIPEEEDIDRNGPEWKNYIKQRKFLEEILPSLGINVRTVHLQKLPSGEYKEKGLDVLIASDATDMASKYDTCILVTGDGDFVSLVMKIKEEKKKRIEIAGFIGNTYSELINACDKFIPLDYYIDKIKLKE